jgi:hypothetical protein
MRIHRFSVIAAAVFAVAAAAAAGCAGQPGDPAPLAEMTNKSLYVAGLPGSGGDIGVSLFADGCPLLVPGTVRATLNGRAMSVDPGKHDGPFGPPCYQPTFSLSPLPADLGDTLTIEISDSSETLRVVIAGYHPDTPQLEPAPTGEPRVVHRGDPLSFGFSIVGDQPDVASASVGESGTPTAGAPCTYDAAAPSAIVGSAIEFQVPASLCYSEADIWACLGFSGQTHLVSCENATCTLDDFTTFGCQHYPVSIQP